MARRHLVRSIIALSAALGTLLQAQVGVPARQWPTYGGDAGSTKYSPLDQITRDNVDELRIVWEWQSADNPIVMANRRELPALPAAFKSTPILADGVLYLKTSLSQAAAIDAATGETLWVFDPGTWEGARPANTGFNSRGVAYWSDGEEARVFLPTGDAYLYALDARTGQPIADFGADGAIDATQGLRRPIPRGDYQLMGAPMVVGDVVVIGSVIFDSFRYQLGPPGDIRGFDVRTGEEVWEFHTIPQEGEFGNETWEDGSWRYTGAANAWGSLSADLELGYVYVPLGTPTNDYYGGHRLGDNLFAESIVCLDARSGERVWHFQFAHHGLWDYDAAAAPILVDLTVDGRPIKAVAVVTKQAYTFVFDRVTGAPVWPIEERPAPPSSVPGERASPTQPHPHQAPGVRSSRRGGRRPHRLHARAAAGSGGDPRALCLRALVHPAGTRGEREARDHQYAGNDGRRKLARRGSRSGNWLALCSVQDRADRHTGGPTRSDTVGLPVLSPPAGITGPSRAAPLQAAICSAERVRPEHRRPGVDGATRRRPEAGAHRHGRSRPRSARRRDSTILYIYASTRAVVPYGRASSARWPASIPSMAMLPS